MQNSVGEFELRTGGLNDTLNYSDVNEVDCTNLNCNKRISCAGQEWLVGRLCNRPIGARKAARKCEMCSVPYATRTTDSHLTWATTPMKKIKHHQEDPEKTKHHESTSSKYFKKSSS